MPCAVARNKTDDVVVRMALWPLIAQRKIELTHKFTLSRELPFGKWQPVAKIVFIPVGIRRYSVAVQRSRDRSSFTLRTSEGEICGEGFRGWLPLRGVSYA